MTRIAATILSGNSAGVVADAVRSIVAWVDLVLLIDTGITDDTCRIVQEIAGDKFRVAIFPWQSDFAAARNYALRAAADVGATWALTLDTDERLSIAGFACLEELRAKLDSESGVLAWLVPYGQTGYAKERFIRVPTRLAWRGRTHEALIGAGEGERKLLEGIAFTELAKSAEQMAAKLQRDVEILHEETQRQPKNPRWWYYLGQTLAEMGRHADAVGPFQKCAFLNGWDEESAWACYRAAWSLHELGNFKKALEMCAFGLARHSGFPELPWLAGLCCLRLGQLEKAVWWEEMAASLGSYAGIGAAHRRINFRHLPAWYEAPYDIMLAAYRRLNDTVEFERVTQLRAAALSARMRAEGHDPTRIPQHPLGQSGATRGCANGGARSSRNRAIVQNVQRVAVLGLYSSGSTATANVLHCLGVKLGRELFGDYFEPKWLAEQLRLWWQEPDLIERVSRRQRVAALASWLCDLAGEEQTCIAAKHPLLTLCGTDLLEAWGPQTRFIWTWRPLADSIASLKRRGWWPGKEQAVQTRLWNAAEAFFTVQPHLRIEFGDLLCDPQREVERLIEFLKLEPTDTQRTTAVAAVRRRNPNPLPT